MRERLIYYGAKLISDQLKSGQNYGALKQTIVIVITDFSFIEDSMAYHNRYMLYDPQTKSEFTRLLRYDILELEKLPSQKDGSETWSWAKFFTAESEEEFAMLAKENENIDKAVGYMKEMSREETARYLALQEELARMDHINLMQDAERRGREEGRIEGKEDIAVTALKEGLPLDVVAKITGLDLTEVEALQARAANKR